MDPYYYSNRIFTNMLTDVTVLWVFFSIDSINNPISIDNGSRGSPDRETFRK